MYLAILSVILQQSQTSRQFVVCQSEKSSIFDVDVPEKTECSTLAEHYYLPIYLASRPDGVEAYPSLIKVHPTYVG
jgi:hypothetical protein